MGLGYILPPDHVKKAIHSVYRYNFKTDFHDHDNTQRTYVLNDEKGLLICTWPKGGRPEYPFVYSHEVWTGIEYHVAAHLIYEGYLEEGLAIVKAVRGSRVSLGMIFNYRFVPALLKAKQMMDKGLLGRIYSFRGEYYHTGYQNPDRPLTWRMDFSKSGGGALVDMGVHVIDLARFLLGEFDSVQAMTRTYIGDRPLEKGSPQKGRVTVDDAAWMNVRMRNGAVGSIEVSRFATGTLDDLNITVYGEKGALRFSLMDANFLYWFDQLAAGTPEPGLLGWQRLETGQAYPGTSLPNPRSIVGWTRFHAENLHRFIRSVKDGTPFAPDERDGYEAQAVLEAAYQSAESGAWAKVKNWSQVAG